MTSYEDITYEGERKNNKVEDGEKGDSEPVEKGLYTGNIGKDVGEEEKGKIVEEEEKLKRKEDVMRTGNKLGLNWAKFSSSWN